MAQGDLLRALLAELRRRGHRPPAFGPWPKPQTALDAKRLGMPWLPKEPR